MCSNSEPILQAPKPDAVPPELRLYLHNANIELSGFGKRCTELIEGAVFGDGLANESEAALTPAEIEELRELETENATLAMLLGLRDPVPQGEVAEGPHGTGTEEEGVIEPHEIFPLSEVLASLITAPQGAASSAEPTLRRRCRSESVQTDDDTPTFPTRFGAHDPEIYHALDCCTAVFRMVSSMLQPRPLSPLNLEPFSMLLLSRPNPLSTSVPAGPRSYIASTPCCRVVQTANHGTFVRRGVLYVGRSSIVFTDDSSGADANEGAFAAPTNSISRVTLGQSADGFPKPAHGTAAPSVLLMPTTSSNFGVGGTRSEELSQHFYRSLSLHFNYELPSSMPRLVPIQLNLIMLSAASFNCVVSTLYLLATNPAESRRPRCFTSSFDPTCVLEALPPAPSEEHGRPGLNTKIRL